MTALFIALASGKTAVNFSFPKGLSRTSDRQPLHPRNLQIRIESVSMYTDIPFRLSYAAAREGTKASQPPSSRKKENHMAEPRVARYTDIVPAKKTVIGSNVVNARNEDLGKIDSARVVSLD